MGRVSDGNSSGTVNYRGLFLFGCNERGMLLLDLLLGLTLALLIIGILQQTAGLVFSGYMNSISNADMQYSVRVALECIQQDIRTSQDFQVSADGSLLFITGASGEDIRIYAQNGNLYRRKVSTVPIAENFSGVSFIKTGSGLQGNLKLNNQGKDYEVDFFCFSRTMKAQEQQDD